MPIIPATREAEAGELLESRRRRLQWAKITPLYSSLGNRSETPSQKENDEKKLEILLKKKQELKNERDKILENKKNKISILDKKYKEENKKKIELMKSLDMQLKQIKNEQNKFIKELHQSAKKFDKKENELSLEIIELQKKLCIPITEQAKIPTPHKKQLTRKKIKILMKQ